MTSLMRCIRRSRINAAKSTTASLASSDGWMPKPASANQRRVPLTGREKSTAASSTAATTSSVQISRSFL